MIFDRFEQAEKDTERKFGGTGLGLDISKQLSLMHGGDLTVRGNHVFLKTLGGLLPVDVVLRATCAQCGGRGETWAEHCLACDGTGHALVSRRLRVTVPPRISDGSCFHFRIHAPHEASVHVEIRIAITET